MIKFVDYDLLALSSFLALQQDKLSKLLHIFPNFSVIEWYCFAFLGFSPLPVLLTTTESTTAKKTIQ